MKKIVLEVQEIDSFNNNSNYDANSYPSDGVFIFSTDQSIIYFVSKTKSIVYSIPIDLIPSPLIESKEVPKPNNNEALLLKAIAIVRQPDLAIQLIKE